MNEGEDQLETVPFLSINNTDDGQICCELRPIRQFKSKQSIREYDDWRNFIVEYGRIRECGQ